MMMMMIIEKTIFLITIPKSVKNLTNETILKEVATKNKLRY